MELEPSAADSSGSTALGLGFNSLSGEIPAELGSLSSLTELSLADNYQLSGCVPSSLEDQLDFDESDIGDLPFC